MKCLGMIFLLLILGGTSYGQKNEKAFDEKTLLTAISSVSAMVADCELSRRKIERNPILRGKEGRLSPAKCYGYSSSFIAGSLIGEWLLPKQRKVWNQIRLGVTIGHGIGFTVTLIK